MSGMRTLSVVLVGSSVVVAIVAGCSSSPSSSPVTSASTPPSSSSTSSKQADKPLPDPAALLKQSSATTRDLKTAHLALSVTGKVQEMPVNTLEADLANEPAAAAKGDAKIAIMGTEVGIRFVVFGGHLYGSLPNEGWVDYGSTSKVFDVTAILNPDTGLANVLAEFIDPKVETRETIVGQQTIRVVGKITADAVNKLVPQLHATKRMACTVWIQESGDHQLVRATLEPGKDDSIQMTLSNWNIPVTVDKPAGV